MKKTSYIGVIALLLVACSATPKVTTTQVNYDPATQARLRLYGQEGSISIATYTDNNKKIRINAGNAIVRDDFGLLTTDKYSGSLGMPTTSFSRSVAERSGLFSRAYFKEFIVPAHTHIDVKAAAFTMTNSDDSYRKITAYSDKGCQESFSFTPQAGVDYEVAYSGCYPVLYELKAIE